MLALDIFNTFYGRNGYEGVGQAKAVMFFLIVCCDCSSAITFLPEEGVGELMNTKNRIKNNIVFIFVLILAILFLSPIFIVLMNSFKGRFFISDTPFALPNAQTFVGLKNYTSGIAKTGFIPAFGYSLFITVFSVGAIVLFTSMTAWCITRVKSKLSTLIYYLLVFSMIVPFQMVMFTMSKMANILHLDNPIGIIVIYLGFGAGLSVFIFSGFIKSNPS